MHRTYRYRKPDRLKKMVIFALVASLIVFSLVYFLFVEKDTARVVAKVQPPAANGTQNGGNGGAAGCDDECLLDLALVKSNSSYCMNVSAANSDRCWEMFADYEFDACTSLMNYSMRKGCLNGFALAQKNESICWMLQAADVDACRDAVSPPCANISEGAEKELCLALRYGNYSYCASAACTLAYANVTGDEGACAALASEPEEAACRSIASKGNRCSGLRTSDREYCYLLLAKYTNDYGYCDEIESDYFNASCYYAAAIYYKDYTYCEKDTLDYIWDCYRNYSLETGDLSACYEIDSYAEGNFNSCLNNYASKYEDPSVCNGLTTIYMRTNCYAGIILSSQNLTLEKCSGVANPDWKDKCYSYYVKSGGDPSACGYIENSAEKTRCEGY